MGASRLWWKRFVEHVSFELVLVRAHAQTIANQPWLTENSGKLLGGRSSAPNPAGELTTLPRPPAGGEGLLPTSQEPTFGPSLLPPSPQWKILGTPLYIIRRYTNL